MAGQFDTIDAETVAVLLGVSARQVNNYLNLKGLPSQGEGRRRVFVWREVLEWYVAYRTEMELGGGNDGTDDAEMEVAGSGKEDIRAANLRKTRAEADLKQLALSKLRGEVITIHDARVRLDRFMANLRALLLSMPPSLAGRLQGERDASNHERIIRDEMDALCRTASTAAIVDVPADEPSGEAIAEMSAAADREFTDEEADAIFTAWLEETLRGQPWWKESHAALQR